MQTDKIKSQTLNTVKAAEYCGWSEAFMRKMRANDEGPAYIKVGGRRIMYLVKDLDSYLESCRVETAEVTA